MGGFQMSHLRTGRRKYYDLFSPFYYAFIRLHARQDEDDTRYLLVDAAHLKDKSARLMVDICCGTGSVVLAFAERCPGAVLVGYDIGHPAFSVYKIIADLGDYLSKKGWYGLEGALAMEEPQ